MSEENDNKSGVNITISEKTTERVWEVLSDIFKPLAQGLGVLGDKIQIYRERTTIATLRKAQRIAQEESKTIELPPPKFLVPYLNSASLEDESDEKMQEKWAHLLVNSGNNPSAVTYFALNLLGQISAQEASDLDEVVNDTNAADFSDFANYTAAQRSLQNEVLKRLQEVCKQADTETFGDKNAAFKPFNLVILQPGLLPVRWTVSTTNTQLNPTGRDFISFENRLFGDTYHLYLMLESRNLISTNSVNTDLRQKPYCRFETVSLTKLGFELVKILYPVPKKT